MICDKNTTTAVRRDVHESVGHKTMGHLIQKKYRGTGHYFDTMYIPGCPELHFWRVCNGGMISFFFILNIKKGTRPGFYKDTLTMPPGWRLGFSCFSCNSAAPYCHLVRSFPKSIRPGQLITLSSLKIFLTWDQGV